jgi:hypothetical protein
MRLWRSGSSQLSCHNQTDQLTARFAGPISRRRFIRPASASAFPNAWYWPVSTPGGQFDFISDLV